MLPLAQKYLFFYERMNFRVFRQMGSSSGTNLRYARESRQGKLESSYALQLPMPSTSYAKMSTPSSWMIPYRQILSLMRSECSNILFDRDWLQEYQTELVGILVRMSLATSARQLDAMALPGILQGSQLGLSEGRNPVLIMPVYMAVLITPLGNSSVLLLKVQYSFPNFSFQNWVSLTCSSNTARILVIALKNLRLRKSSLLNLWQYSCANLKKAEGESTYHFLSQICSVAYSFFRHRSTPIPIISVSLTSFKQDGRFFVEFQYRLNALVQPSTIKNYA